MKPDSIMKPLSHLFVAALILASGIAAADEFSRFPVKPAADELEKTVDVLKAAGFRQAPDEEVLFVSSPSVNDNNLSRIPDIPFSFGLNLGGNALTNDDPTLVSMRAQFDF